MNLYKYLPIPEITNGGSYCCQRHVSRSHIMNRQKLSINSMEQIMVLFDIVFRINSLCISVGASTSASCKSIDSMHYYPIIMWHFAYRRSDSDDKNLNLSHKYCCKIGIEGVDRDDVSLDIKTCLITEYFYGLDSISV